jgi:hypothetical protein
MIDEDSAGNQFTVPALQNAVTALMADTGFTQGGTMTYATLMNVIAAMAAGNWRVKSTDSDVQELLDPDDGTVILEQTLSESTAIRTITLKI